MDLFWGFSWPNKFNQQTFYWWKAIFLEKKTTFKPGLLTPVSCILLKQELASIVSVTGGADLPRLSLWLTSCLEQMWPRGVFMKLSANVHTISADVKSLYLANVEATAPFQAWEWD